MIKTRDFAVGMGLAAAVWTVAFRGRSHFWEKMGVGVGSLGAYALLVNPELRRERPRIVRDTAVGIASAAALYGIFRLGWILAYGNPFARGQTVGLHNERECAAG